MLATSAKMKKYTKEEVRHRFTSVHAWELPKQTGAVAPPDVWTNKDMVSVCSMDCRLVAHHLTSRSSDQDPTPLEDQTWTAKSMVAYWSTDTINLGTWETASGILAVGLSWREALPIMVVGTFCVAIPMV